VLTLVDDTLWFDPRIVFTAPEEGTYYVRTFAFPADPNSTIRYAGAASYIYRLTLSTGPFVDHCLPLAYQYSGTAKPVALQGWNLTGRLKSLQPVAEHSQGKALISHPQLGNWLKIPLSPNPVLLESKESQQEKGQLLSTPGSITGKISEPEEVDIYRFKAKKGESLTFRVDSHTLGYPLDAHLKLFDAKGKLLKEIDDPVRNHFDVRLAYKIPADGEYQIHLTDRFQHGGFRYVYLMSIEPSTTDFKLQAAAEQYTLTTGGKPLEIEVTVNRMSPRFGDDIEISLVGLPKGATRKPIISKVKAKTEKSVKLQLEAKPNTVFQGPLEIRGTSLKNKTKTHLATAVIKGMSPKRKTARPKSDLQLPYLWLTIKKKK
jgi:hypothetical protein